MISGERLKGLQGVLLEMLLEVDRICEKYGIKYCLVMGTMLGAVRHGGFIPWDDDLDIAILREDYERFKAACTQDLDSERFYYQDDQTDPHYRWGYARIRRKGSEFIRLGQEHMKMRTGIFLDIFPMDSAPDSRPLRELHGFYCFILRKLLYAELGRKSAATRALRTWYALLNIIPHSWVHRRVRGLSRNNKKTKYVRIITFPLPKGQKTPYLRSWFEELKYISFESQQFPVIRDHDAFLRFSYGDYMQLPPPEKRVCCHPASNIRLPSEPEQ